MNYYSEHSKVWVSVDVIIFGFDENKLKVLIGRRQMDPGRGERVEPLRRLRRRAGEYRRGSCSHAAGAHRLA